MLDKLKDWSIVYSFDKSGFERHARHFSQLSGDSVKGKRYLITGGTSGIGEALASRLLRSGAKVLVTGRGEEKFKRSSLPDLGGEFAALDMADLAEVAAFDPGPIDGLVCNAGGMPDELETVDDCCDSIFASQVIGHYILIKQLIERGLLRANSPIHITSSGGMYLRRLKLNDLRWEQEEYDKVKAYANAKRAQVILNDELSTRHRDFHFSCSHPGWVGTAALEKALPGFVNKLRDRLRSAEEGADTIYWCLHECKDLPTGKFWFDRKARWEYPFFWTRESASTRQELLQLCESKFKSHFSST